MKLRFFLFFSCLLTFSNCDDGDYTIIGGTSTKREPKPSERVHKVSVEEEEDQTDYSDCVFDTNTCQFTTKAIIKFDPKTSFSYSNKTKQAIALLENNDTLWLHIGGCNAFSYSAKLSTAIPFSETKELTEKAKWMARTFFEGSGFDEKYKECIDKGLYEESKAGNPLQKHFEILDPDTNITNLIYNGFTFIEKGDRVHIEVSGYVD